VEKNIKKDFGSVSIKNRTDIYEQIRSYMEQHGYNVKNCDVCSIENESFDDRDVVKFKFVHYSVRSMVTEPYYKIEFTYGE
jgi:hypothetical protein